MKQSQNLITYFIYNCKLYVYHNQKNTKINRYCLQRNLEHNILNLNYKRNDNQTR